jgi:anti-sigma regulatory factor (Ser/Thr protein kinase)
MSGCANIIQRHTTAPVPGSGEDDVSRPLLRLSALDLRPLPTAVPCARLHARNVLLAWGLADLAADSELIVSEIVTNGIRASLEAAAGAEPLPVRLRLSAWADHSGRVQKVQVEVWDASASMPRQSRRAPLDEPGGWGLVLVEALSARWGCYPAREGGKVVFAVIDR